MASRKEIEAILKVVCNDIDLCFMKKGLDFQTFDFDIQVLSQKDIGVKKCSGLYNPLLNRIEINRALFTRLMNDIKGNSNINIYAIKHYLMLKETIIHEIGHNLHHTQFDSRDYALEVINDYGNKNKFERFAVAFQEYMTENRENNGMKEILESIG